MGNFHKLANVPIKKVKENKENSLFIQKNQENI